MATRTACSPVTATRTTQISCTLAILLTGIGCQAIAPKSPTTSSSTIATSPTTRSNPQNLSPRVAQWSCGGNRRVGVDVRQRPLEGGWLNQEEYCEWDRNGVAPAKITDDTFKPKKLQCIVRTSFDQGRTYYLQQRTYHPRVHQQNNEHFGSVNALKSSYYDTKFNGYAFLVGGREGYHVWDSRIWKQMGETGDTRLAYISDTRKGIIGHCKQFNCKDADETGFLGNCVEGRQSDPLICNVINEIYCSGTYAGPDCKQMFELNLTKRPVIHADPNHIARHGKIDPVLNPQMQLDFAALKVLEPMPSPREDVLYRADYFAPTAIGDTPIKLDLVIPDGLKECHHLVDPMLRKYNRVRDDRKFFESDRTLVECNFPTNTRYYNCDEVAAQLQVRAIFDIQPVSDRQ
jgi:hypothetical protein